MSGTRRIEDPHYGMVVTDATGLFMLTLQRSPQARGDENLVWHAWRLDAPSGGSLSTRAYLLLLDPDQFGEVVE